MDGVEVHEGAQTVEYVIGCDFNIRIRIILSPSRLIGHDWSRHAYSELFVKRRTE